MFLYECQALFCGVSVRAPARGFTLRKGKGRAAAPFFAFFGFRRGIPLRGYPDTVEAELDRFLSAFDITVVRFGPDEYRHAADAFRRYGKGRHPARLNFGD